MWERRYGFPVPGRDAKGERLYPAHQVVRLRQLRRLIQAGHRPGQVVALAPEALDALLAQAGPQATPGARAKGARPGKPPAAQASTARAALVQACMARIAAHDVAGLRELIARTVLAQGLGDCVVHLVAPLTREVGLAWVHGRFEVFEEHLYTECVTGVLRGAIAGVPAASEARRPRVLMTTFTYEQHGLGLLMLEALLALHGCECLPLGTQTPHADIVRAAAAFRADIVALSFSGILAPAQVRAGVRELRAQLDSRALLWVGGQGAVLPPGERAGITLLQQLEAVPEALALWRAATNPTTLAPG